MVVVTKEPERTIMDRGNDRVAQEEEEEEEMRRRQDLHQDATEDETNHTEDPLLPQRGCLEQTLRCIGIPCFVCTGMWKSCCCPTACGGVAPPPEWTPSLAAAIALMRAVTHNIVRNICCIRCLTDQTIPTWLPALPSAKVRVLYQKKAVHTSDNARETGCPVAGEWTIPRHHGPTTDPRTRLPSRIILYFHGGAFCLCRPMTLRGITMHLASQFYNDPDIDDEHNNASVAIFCLDYRRPPENPYPDPVYDCLAAYEWLYHRYQTELGLSATEAANCIVLAGDSAGGFLVVSTLAAIRQRQLAFPAGSILLSPWVAPHDVSSASWSENAPYDYLPLDLSQQLAASFLPSGDWDTVAATNQDLQGFPPLLIYCGELEVLRDQVVEFAEKCRAKGVQVTCHVEPAMVHVFMVFSDLVAQETQNRWFQTMADFVRQVTDTNSRSQDDDEHNGEAKT